MGMLINGKWRTRDSVIRNGAYIRPPSPLHGARDPENLDALGKGTGRFWLIASHSCPWSHRTTLVRALKGLDKQVPVHFAYGARIEGYALADGAAWPVPGTNEKIRHLHELYALHDRRYTGRATVPVLWDSERLKIVSNESADIIRAFDAIAAQSAPDFTLNPQVMAPDIAAANDWIYEGLNNAVYRAGFARTQHAYDEAVRQVFATLDRLEARLASSRYYFGNTLTETDIRLFPTLVRFDAIYYILFKCSRRRLIDYPHLWAYARDLHGWRGISGTVDFNAMRQASYLADADGAHPLVAVRPDADWTAVHNRGSLGVARIALRHGGTQCIDPHTLCPVEAKEAAPLADDDKVRDRIGLGQPLQPVGHVFYRCGVRLSV